MNNNYLITLEPLGSFFFGGEETFGSQDGNSKNYYARSNYYPQQTALLGMLRYQILAKEGKLGKQPSNVIRELIGEKSFIVDENPQIFGHIKNLSPVFLIDNNEYYIPQALDYSTYNKEPDKEKKDNIALSHLSVSFNKEKTSSYLNNNCPRPTVSIVTADNKAFSPKNERPSLLISNKGNIRLLDAELDYNKTPLYDKDKVFYGIARNGLFMQSPQVGIEKQTNRKKDIADSKFYKQNFLKLAPQCKFAFFAELSYELESGIVHLGGERSAFQMTVTSTSDTFDTVFKDVYSKEKRNNCIVLTSNAYIDTTSSDKDKCPAISIESLCDYYITEAVPFRNIQTINDNSDYIKLGKAVSKSPQLFQLLKRGSIFYACDNKDLTCLKEALNNSSFTTIGYNKYIEIKNSK